MEGLVLSATAFMSFASILWLVVAKLATGNEDEASETASANNDEDEATNVLTSVTSKFTQILSISKCPEIKPVKMTCEDIFVDILNDCQIFTSN